MKDRRAEAEALLNQARHILRVQGRPDTYGWSLIASNLVSAHQLLCSDSPSELGCQRQLLNAVLIELKDATRNFTDAEFLKSTRAARRQAPGLFKS